MVINSTQDYHDTITKLYDDYYKAKKDAKPTIDERNYASSALIEAYIEEHGKRPPNAILSRLATYVLLDTLTDSHPDKMSREEYPIMSYGQTGRYFKRNGKLSDEPFPPEEVIGRIKELDDMDNGVNNALLNPESSEQRARDWRLFIRGLLTEREAIIIERMYKDGATQAEIAEELGISSRWVREIHTNILDKLREIIHK